MTATLAEVKYEVAIANRILWALDLASGVTASLGHASLRVPGRPQHFVVKGRGYQVDALAAMRPEDMVVCDTEGFFIDGPPGSTQCFEVKMHACIYKLYPQVQSVVHVHPRFTVLLTTLGQTIKPMCQEGIQLVQKPLPMYPHVKTIQTDAEGMEVAALMAGHNALLLQGHGATTTGSDLEEAVMNMLRLEEQARMNYYALSAVGPDYPCIPDALIDEMSNRTPLAELPHFKAPLARVGGRSRVGGVWQYYTAEVSKGL